MSSSLPVDNKKKDILTLSQVPTQRLDDTTLTAEKDIQSLLLSLGKKIV